MNLDLPNSEPDPLTAELLGALALHGAKLDTIQFQLDLRSRLCSLGPYTRDVVPKYSCSLQ